MREIKLSVLCDSTELFSYPPAPSANGGGSLGNFANIHRKPQTMTFGWAFLAITEAIFSIMLYLTPLPKFYAVYVQGWIEGLMTPVPYSISIFTCMLRMSYALLNGYDLQLIINIVGFIFSTIYITIYLKYAPKEDKIYTIKLILVDVALFLLILLTTLLVWEGTERLVVLGWIYLSCLTITTCLSPLSTTYQVIQTRSVKCMPFYDPLLTTLGASASLANAILIIDNIQIAVPHALSLMFGVIQMVIYMKYKDVNSTPQTEESTRAGEINNEMVEEGGM